MAPKNHPESVVTSTNFRMANNDNTIMEVEENQKQNIRGENDCSNSVNGISAVKVSVVLLLPAVLFVTLAFSEHQALPGGIPDETQCSRTCRIRFVESVPDNVSFVTTSRSDTTYSAWHSLISNSENELLLAAYKTSLRGKHVLDKDYCQLYSNQGSAIYDAVLEAGLKRKVRIRMIENYPPKDKGDNEDGISFANTGVINRRSLNLVHLLGGGKMHTKFIISDSKHFYLGSANLDWRSLNQKLELGVVVENCPCLARDLSNIFEDYWEVGDNKYNSDNHGNFRNYPKENYRNAVYNQQRPLPVSNQDASVDVYVAASPRTVNGRGREWDLDAILDAVEKAQEFLYIEVMDYFPMFVYNSSKRYWPIIDDSIRRAILRGVEVKILTAAIHFPELSLRFLSSLEMLNGISSDDSIQVKIFKVPTDVHLQHIMIRERRLHTKFLASETVVVVGTSNWSGDYFDDGTTGVALVLNQTKELPKNRHFVNELRRIFLSHWTSDYTHSVLDYERDCLETRIGNYCEAEKDPSFLAV